MDRYTYARKHDAGPGAWCVRGPNDFEMYIPRLTKDAAYLIGKVLSGDLEALRGYVKDTRDSERLVGISEMKGATPAIQPSATAQVTTEA